MSNTITIKCHDIPSASEFEDYTIVYANAIAGVLNNILKENREREDYQDILKREKNSIFYSNGCSLEISSYLERIIKYTNVEPTSLILALINMDKILIKNKFILNDRNVYKYFIFYF